MVDNAFDMSVIALMLIAEMMVPDMLGSRAACDRLLLINFANDITHSLNTNDNQRGHKGRGFQWFAMGHWSDQSFPHSIEVLAQCVLCRSLSHVLVRIEWFSCLVSYVDLMGFNVWFNVVFITFHYVSLGNSEQQGRV